MSKNIFSVLCTVSPLISNSAGEYKTVGNKLPSEIVIKQQAKFFCMKCLNEMHTWNFVR